MDGGGVAKPGARRGGKPFYWQPKVSEWFADQDKGRVYKQRDAADRAAEMWGGEVVEIMHVGPPTPPTERPTEDEIAFGKNAWIYCRAHVNAHETGWCSVGIRDKVALGVRTAEEALQKCCDWGFPLHRDR